jgi:beta-glucosidase
VAEQLGDRVKHYFTINEFRSFVEGGYQRIEVQVGGGKTVNLGGAPGLALSPNSTRYGTMPCWGMASPFRRSVPAADRTPGSDWPRT